MRRLLLASFNTIVLNSTKPQRLSGRLQIHQWRQYGSVSCYINNHQELILSPCSNGLTTCTPGCCGKLNNVKWFSTTPALLSRNKDRATGKKKPPPPVDLRELGEVLDVEKLLARYERAFESLKDQFIKYVSLRTTTGAIDQVPVTFEGETYVLQELVQITRNPKTVILNASSFPETIPSIIQSLSKTQMNLNPQQDGTKIFIQIPKVTKEHRESLAKHAKSLLIKCRDNIRDVRNEHINKVKKTKGLPEDLVYRAESYIDTLHHQYVEKANKLFEAKNKELLGDSS